MENIYKWITQDQVTFMIDIDNIVEINAFDRFKYFNCFQFKIREVKKFLYNLDEETIYTIIPFITVSSKLTDPILILLKHKQILVIRESNPLTIINYLINQYEILKSSQDFNILDLDNFNVLFHIKVELCQNSPK